ncbi:MAG: penicillin-binding protein 2 [Synergistaceae bacterium]|nr:penicillin-binding protein 2 [Synergistaceae bacterium]
MSKVKKNKRGNPWILFLFFFTVISVTLVARHCYPDSRVVQRSRHQYWRKVNLQSTRGIIQDVKGNALVISDTIPSFAVDPSILEEKDLEKFSGILSGDLLTKIQTAIEKKSRFMWLEHKVKDENEAEKYKSIKKELSDPRALIEIDEPYRKYTNNNLMSHVLGFCDADNKGQAGIEQVWDNTLYNPSGQKIVVRRPGSQPALLFENEIEQRTVTPVITLTLDSRMQYVVEKHLFKAAQDNGAKWAVCVCMDPNTGEIFAMASYPTYDPQNRKSLTIESLSNSVVSRGYEPGSTFKPIYLGIALERGWAKPDELFFCPAKLKVADGFIRESNSNVAMGNIDTADLLIKSSNVGMAQIGIRAEKTKTYESLLALGFGRESDIELPGIARGILPYPENWRGITPANIAIGQGLAVTPLQLITAMGAIVNGGKLMSPYIVKEAINSQGEVVYKGTPKIMREVYTPETAAWIRRAMRRVVLEGTGKRAATEVTELAGKTGTAQVPEGGKYSRNRYVASFIGFWPYDAPKYLMLVVIGEPSSGRIYGGELAAPTFKSIVEEMAELEYYAMNR